MKLRWLLCVGLLALCAWDDGCGPDPTPASQQATSGIKRAQVHLTTGSDGLTVEQRNIGQRLLEDNKPGAIKHLYVISPYSGQVILYSTVKGKVTSGGKRLAPTTVAAGTVRGDNSYHDYGIPISLGGESQLTSEVTQDDGTYGSSGDYLYWWDVRGAYHQHYLTGGQIITISDQPLPVKSITINVEAEAGGFTK